MTKIPALHPTIRAWLLEARSGVRHAAQARRLCDQPENAVIMRRRREAVVPESPIVSRFGRSPRGNFS